MKAVNFVTTQRAYFPSGPDVFPIAYGKDVWATYFGDVGVEPPLPTNINALLNAETPYNSFYGSRVKVKDNHILLLIPQTVDGYPLTLTLLGDLIKNPKNNGHPTQFRYFYGGGHENTPAPKSHWVLMQYDNKLAPSGKPFNSDALQIIQRYEKPNLLETTVCILMHHVVTGKYLINSEYSKCVESPLSKPYGNVYPDPNIVYPESYMVVGGFCPVGLGIYDNRHGDVAGAVYDDCFKTIRL